MILKKRMLILTAFLAFLASWAMGARPTTHPDFKAIREETHNPDSKFYYPRLLAAYFSNDTTMTDDDYHYLYYGSMFQEDYNPYRINPFEAELKATEPLYSRHGTLTRSEKRQIQQLAEKSLANNPFNLKQLSHLIYAYEQSDKTNLAKIWQHKLNRLLLTIAASGTGADKEHAIVVVDPSNELDFFFLSNIVPEGREYEPPYYECFLVRPPGATEPRKVWFDLHHLLEQYYLKHPTEKD